MGQPNPYPPQSSGKAIVSFVFSILGISCILPIIGPLIAIILGHLALGEIKRSQGQLTGSGLAMSGTILGYLGLASVILIVPIMAGMLLPVLSKAREKARRVNCSGNLKQIGLGMLMYSGEYSGYFPKDFSVLDKTGELPAGKVYQCPSCDDYNPAFNAADLKAGRSSYDYFGWGLRDDNADATITVVAADKTGNHPGQTWINVLFVDGHVEGCRAKNLQEAAKMRGWIIPGQGPTKEP